MQSLAMQIVRAEIPPAEACAVILFAMRRADGCANSFGLLQPCTFGSACQSFGSGDMQHGRVLVGMGLMSLIVVSPTPSIMK